MKVMKNIIIIILFVILSIYCQNNLENFETNSFKKNECDFDCESSMAPNSVIFTNFIFDSMKIKFKILVKEKGIIKISDEIFFKFNKNIDISNDTLAVMLAICAKIKYNYIYIDLIITKRVFEKINNYTYGDIRVKNVIDNSEIKQKKDKIIVNFSGGLDSLSLLSLLPKDSYTLISVAWEGFTREKNFFIKFNPFIVETNFRKFLDERKIWEFMGIGSLFYNEIINAKYQTWGTIFECCFFSGSYKFAGLKSFISPPFNIMGINDIKLIQGLTEIGTALIVLKDHPFLANESLISLASEDSSKRLRKNLIVKILIRKYNLTNVYLGFDEIKEPKNKIKWGYFTDDFLVFWIIKNMGYEESSKYILNIPQDINEIIESNSLTFYEKFNTNYLNNIPIKFKSKILENIIRLNIEFYDENDFKELKNVLIYMKKYNSNLQKEWDKYYN